MMKKHLLVVVLSLVYSSYSYSEEVYGSTNNAAATGLNWVMTNILPEYAGLEVNGLVYQYTAVKDPESDMIVYVQNEYADGNGYIFRNADDWSGIPGNTINKSFVFPNLAAELWGPGSIEVNGDGSVEDPSVVYTYKYDTCYDPQTNPDCPGYEEPVEVPEIPFSDPLEDQLVLDEINKQAEIDREQEEEDRRRRQKESKVKGALEKLLADSTNPELISAEAEKMAVALFNVTLPTSYYSLLQGGEYIETVQLDGGEIQDNKRARRINFAQQLLHTEIVNSQYETGASAQQEK
jgi:hypothetical protein